MWMQAVRDSCIGVSVTSLFLEYLAAIVVYQICVLLHSLSLILLLCVTLSSSSAQLSYRLRPDLLSILFLSTLSPISSASKRPTAISLFTLQYKYHTALFCISFRQTAICNLKNVWNTSCISCQDNMMEGNHLMDLAIDGRIILK